MHSSFAHMLEAVAREGPREVGDFSPPKDRGRCEPCLGRGIVSIPRGVRTCSDCGGTGKART